MQESKVMSLRFIALSLPFSIIDPRKGDEKSVGGSRQKRAKGENGREEKI